MRAHCFWVPCCESSPRWRSRVLKASCVHRGGYAVLALQICSGRYDDDDGARRPPAADRVADAAQPSAAAASRGSERSLLTSEEGEALRRSEARFRAPIEKSNDAISLTSANGVTFYRSPAIAKMLGWSSEEMARRAWADSIFPEDRARFSDEIAALVRKGERDFALEFRAWHRDGSDGRARRQLDVGLGRDGQNHLVGGVLSDLRRSAGNGHERRDLRRVRVSCGSRARSARQPRRRRVQPAL